MTIAARVASLGLAACAACAGAAGGAEVHAIEARRLIERCEVRSVHFSADAILLGMRSGESVRYADDETESGRRALSEALTQVPEQCDPIETTVERVEHGGPPSPDPYGR